MSEKRRDKKGRVLRNGELQRSDGKYEYRYIDVTGERRSVYSWRLVETDKLPSGKRECVPLRDLEKEVTDCLSNGMTVYESKKVTLNDMFYKCMDIKTTLKGSTRTCYYVDHNAHVKNTIGAMRLCDINYSTVKKFYNDLIDKKGLSVRYAISMQKILGSSFKLAVRDGLIREDPSIGIVSEIKKERKFIPVKKKALTVEEQEAFFNEAAKMKISRKKIPFFKFMLGTGCRFGEAAGLMWEDCDFENNLIYIRHTVALKKEERDGQLVGSSVVYLSDPKTTHSIRTIPMIKSVKQTLLEEYQRQTEDGFNSVKIGEYTGFVFVNNNGNINNLSDINSCIHNIVNRNNKRVVRSGDGVIIPKDMTCHTFRRTFCTRLCESRVPLDVIKELMGHSNIRMIMDVYNDITNERMTSVMLDHEEDLCLG